MERPLTPYFDIFRQKGIFFEKKDGVLTVQGDLPPGEYALPGDVSSQFFTGLLLALPLRDGPSVLVPTTPLESEGYITLTAQAMDAFGVASLSSPSLPPRYSVSGGQVYRPARVRVEADWSQAGVWYAIRGLGSPVETVGLDPNSAQGDRILAQYSRMLDGPGEAVLDAAQCPDLVPTLAAHAALREGKVTRIVNAGRLRLKESDRLAAVAEELNRLGGRVEEGGDFLAITGVKELRGGRADCHNDHRIAMMLAAAATRCAGEVALAGAECVAKSYPDFWEEYRRLGGILRREA